MIDEIERRLYIKTINLVKRKSKDYEMGILNRRANEKLNYVISTYAGALRGYWRTEDNGFLYKRISFNDLYHLKELKMSYILKDRLFARSYDLVIEYEVPAIFNEQLKFGLRYLGRNKINGAKFVVLLGNQDVGPILEKLNNPLIHDRLVKLDLIDLNVEYSPQEKKWYVLTDSLIGSSTWNLIPPALQVIKPTEKECVMMIELFELIADALRND